ncbi:MAG: hypothetical protein ABIT96_10970, partial [Ferruginibacter sp.]
MPEKEDHIERIAGKMQQVLRQYEGLQKENSQLRIKLQALENDFIKIAEMSEALAQQNIVLKTSNGTTDAAEKKALASQLNAYIK